jgi:phosphatidylglycerol:prolipoprotein diacylglycerol transferase
MSSLEALNQRFDSVVEASHRIKILGRKYHPYLLMSDLAVAAGLLFAWHFVRVMGGLNFFGFLGIFISVRLAYRGALKLKARYLGSSSRSLLQDTLFFLLPLYALLIDLAGYSLKSALDLAGLFLPLYFGLVRLGCFSGGCCYGIPSRFGVFYRDSVFQHVSGCRKFSPGENPRARVFPIQLVECMVHLTLFAWLWRRLESVGHPDGRTLPLYFLCYAGARFVLDFARRSSARPRVGALSEAQLVSMVLMGACLAILKAMGSG